MSSRLDYDRAAIILVEALFFGDKTTSEKWGVHRRTIENYRKRLNEDSELVHIFRLKKADFEYNWAESIPGAIRQAIAFIGRAATEADPKDPDAIHSIAGAIKILAEVGLTKEIIDARLGRGDRPDTEESRQVDTGAIEVR